MTLLWPPSKNAYSFLFVRLARNATIDLDCQEILDSCKITIQNIQQSWQGLFPRVIGKRRINNRALTLEYVEIDGTLCPTNLFRFYFFNRGPRTTMIQVPNFSSIRCSNTYKQSCRLRRWVDESARPTSVTSTSCKYSSHLFGIEFSRDRERSTGSRAPSPRDALHLLLASHQPMSGAHIASSLNIFSRIRRSIGIEWPSSCYARHRARCGSSRHADCVLGKEM